MPRRLSSRAQLRVDVAQRPRDPVADGAGLAGDAAAVDADADVDVALVAGCNQRLACDDLQVVAGEVLVEAAAVDLDGAAAGAQDPWRSSSCACRSPGSWRRRRAGDLGRTGDGSRPPRRSAPRAWRAPPPRPRAGRAPRRRARARARSRSARDRRRGLVLPCLGLFSSVLGVGSAARPAPRACAAPAPRRRAPARRRRASPAGRLGGGLRSRRRAARRRAPRRACSAALLRRRAAPAVAPSSSAGVVLLLFFGVKSLDLHRLRLLGSVRVLGAGVDLELANLLAARAGCGAACR